MSLLKLFGSLNGNHRVRPRVRPMQSKPVPAVRYLAALGFTGMAVTAIAIVDRTLSFPPFVLLAVAAGLSAAFGGRGPALLAVAVAAIASDFFFTEPRYELSMNRTTLGLAALYAASALISRGGIYWSEKRRPSGCGDARRQYCRPHRVSDTDTAGAWSVGRSRQCSHSFDNAVARLVPNCRPP